MKAILICFLLIQMNLTFAQNLPIPYANGSWGIIEAVGPPVYPAFEKGYVLTASSDTIINDTIHTIWVNGNITKYYNGVFSQYNPANNKYRVWYDFNLKINVVFKNYYDENMIVTNTDSVKIGNKYLKTISFFDGDYWIEAIGSIKRGLFYMPNITDQFRNIYCYNNDSLMTFINNDLPSFILYKSSCDSLDGYIEYYPSLIIKLNDEAIVNMSYNNMSGVLTVDTDIINYQLTVFNSTGNIFYSDMYSNNQEISLLNLYCGIYFVKIIDYKNRVFIKKIIIPIR